MKVQVGDNVLINVKHYSVKYVHTDGTFTAQVAVPYELFTND